MIETLISKLQSDAGTIIFLYALAAAFLQGFWLLFSFEKTLREENFPKLKDMLSFTRERTVIHILTTELANSLKTGYDYARSNIYPIDPDSDVRKLKPDDEITSFFDAFEFESLSKHTADEWVATKSGADLLKKLEDIYQSANKVRNRYKKTVNYCKKSWLTSIILFAFLLCFVSVRVLVPSALEHVVVFITILVFFQLLLYGFYSLLSLLYHRNKLIDEWEDARLYD